MNISRLGNKFSKKMTGRDGKRSLSSAFSTPSPHKNATKPNGQPTPKGAAGPSQPRSARPVYPSPHDKKELVNVVEHFTKLVLEPDMDNVRIDKADEYSPDETLVTQLEAHKPEIINGLEVLLVKSMIDTSVAGEDFNFVKAAADSSECILKMINEMLSLDEADNFHEVAAKMAAYVSRDLTVELQACNMIPKQADNSQTLNIKKGYLRTLNP